MTDCTVRVVCDVHVRIVQVSTRLIFTSTDSAGVYKSCKQPTFLIIHVQQHTPFAPGSHILCEQISHVYVST